jgi:hypothetical protein
MTYNHEIVSLKIVILMVGFYLLIWSFVSPVIAIEHFVKNDNGTIIDKKTGLMWAEKDNEIPINWMEAQSYCKNYRRGGFTDWRMPTLDELSSLYDPNKNNKNGYHISHLIETTAASCWASDTQGDKAARFNFTYGTVYWLRKPYSGPTRVLPVRELQ